jgi:2,4-dienoyl-CoA reductase-like NADH-dependent reductase (Old Yellow Enzyme family)
MPFGEGWVVPRELGEAELDGLVDAFVAATQRALAAGFDVVEMHAAHGYLLHEFLSPLTNRRGDAYGGSVDNRARLPLRVLTAMREAWPENRPLFVRISAADLEPGGLETADMVPLAQTFVRHGGDMVDVSAGGLTSNPVGAHTADQPRMAAQIRREGQVPTIAVGNVTSAATAEALLREDAGDLIAVGRMLLRNPYWTLEAARELGADVPWPMQYAAARS